MSARLHRLRLGRHNQPGQLYLLTTVCRHRVPHLSSAAAARIILDTLHWLDTQDRIELIAAVVMPDHVHFVAAMTRVPLHQLMHSFKSFSAQQINHVLGRCAPVWQAGYHDRALRAEDDLIKVVGYCLHNPVRAGLVEDVRQYPHHWCRWPL
jgi:REP-associated tyrosine transposase